MQEYRDKAKEFAQTYRVEVSEHIIDIMSSVMMTRDNVLQGGSFVRAILNNDLFNAINFADNECMANLKIITLCKEFAHLKHKIK